jgi:hypothetical protein
MDAIEKQRGWGSNGANVVTPNLFCVDSYLFMAGSIVAGLTGAGAVPEVSHLGTDHREREIT